METVSNFTNTEFKNLIKFVALTDTIHDYCNAERVNDKIYKYDTETFIHIILGLLKPEFNKLKDIYTKFYNRLYNENWIWNKNIANIEEYMEKFIIDLLNKKGLLDKNYSNLKKSLLENLDKELIDSNCFKLNIGIINDENIKNISKELYKFLKNDKNLTFITDANSIPCSNKFFCITAKELNTKHYTLYKGIFSQYDAGSHNILKGGNSTKNNNSIISEELIENSNSEISQENLSDNDELSEICIIKDNYPYSLKRTDNELIFVQEIGVKKNPKNNNKFELYTKIKPSSKEKYIDLTEIKDKTLSLSTFVNLLSLIESTLNKTKFVNDRVKEYFDESLLKNITLQTIFDIYQIKLFHGSENYYNTAINTYTKNTTTIESIDQNIEFLKERINIKLKNEFFGNKTVKNIDNKDNLYNELLFEIKNKIDFSKTVKENNEILYTEIEKKLQDSNIILSKGLLSDIINKICSIEKKYIEKKLLEEHQKLIKLLEERKEQSTDYIDLYPEEFNLALLDFKRAMDYLQVKACVESNKQNEEVSYVFVSQDRPAILFALLNNCQCIKTTQMKKTNKKTNVVKGDNILTLYNFGPNKKKIIINASDERQVIYNENINNANLIINKDEEEDNGEIEEIEVEPEEQFENGAINYVELQKIITAIKSENVNVIELSSDILERFQKLIEKYKPEELIEVKNEVEKEIKKAKKNALLLETLFIKSRLNIQTGGRTSTLNYITPTIRKNLIYNTYTRYKDSLNIYNSLRNLKTIITKKTNNKSTTKSTNKTTNISTKNSILKSQIILDKTKQELQDNLQKQVKIDVLIHLFEKEKLYVKFLKIYKDLYGSEMTIFWYITYHTLFFIIDKFYKAESFIDLQKILLSQY